jgi:hypothetical protein
MRIALACGCLLLVPIAVSAQPSMSKAEAAQLYTAAGFPIVNDQPVNRCGKPAKPRVTFVDINGDKRPEALFIDSDAQCYAPSGRYFAILARKDRLAVHRQRQRISQALAEDGRFPGHARYRFRLRSGSPL